MVLFWWHEFVHFLGVQNGLWVAQRCPGNSAQFALQVSSEEGNYFWGPKSSKGTGGSDRKDVFFEDRKL